MKMLENFLKDRNLNILIILFSIITYFSTNYTQFFIIENRLVFTLENSIYLIVLSMILFLVIFGL